MSTHVATLCTVALYFISLTPWSHHEAPEFPVAAEARSHVEKPPEGVSRCFSAQQTLRPSPGPATF